VSHHKQLGIFKELLSYREAVSFNAHAHPLQQHRSKNSETIAKSSPAQTRQTALLLQSGAAEG